MSYTLAEAQNYFSHLTTLGVSGEVVGSLWRESENVEDIDIVVTDTSWADIQVLMNAESIVSIPLHFFVVPSGEYESVKTALRIGDALQARRLMAGKGVKAFHISARAE